MLIIDARFLESGVGRYTRQVVKAVHLSSKKPMAIVCRNKEQKNKLEQYVGAPLNVYCYCDTKMYSVWEQLKMARISKEHVLLTCHFNAPILFQGKLIVSILDLAHLDLPEVFTSRIKRMLTRFLINRVLKKADIVLTISNFSRQRIIDYFGNQYAEKVKNIYLAVESLASKVVRKEVKKYILYVGNIKPHKNLKALLEAFCQLKLNVEYSDIQLLIAGEKVFPGKKLKINEQAFEDVVFSGKVTDSELAFLYKNALCLCFPSFYEGFGLPPLEALQYRTPVLVSDIPVFKETLGENAYYCDPMSVDSIAKGLQKILTAKNTIVKKKKVSALLDKFNFERFAGRLNKALKSVL